MLRLHKAFFASLVFAALCLGSGAVARADTLTLTLPDYNGTFSIGPFPGPSLTVGTFSFTIPAGQQIVAATLGGTFGNLVNGTSAPVNLRLDNFQVAQCAPGAPCTGAFGTTGPTSFTFNFAPAQFSLLTDGAATLALSQLGPGAVRLGGLALTIQTAAPVPEPATLFLLGT
ncbi:MAG: hypothetical protein ACRD68_14440, partial [Pyrinomonadaceae bacterium]